MTQTKTALARQADEGSFSFVSSLADDVWHALEGSHAYEWWYFDALSDDGRDALVVIFLDNFIFSPSYNQNCSQTADDSSIPRKMFPAIAFTYYRDGKPLYRAINEFSADQFSAGKDFPACQIGENSFQFEATPYGTRYLLEINAILPGQKKIHASLEWLIVERDLILKNSREPQSANHASHYWNLVSPRSDVTGKIEVTDAKEKIIDEFQFRGTGYHDHNFDSRWLPLTVKEWQWGRAHFADATAVFYRYLENDAKAATTKIFLNLMGEFSAQDSNFECARKRRDRFGLKYPQLLSFSLAETGGNLFVIQKEVIDSSFFYLRFLSEMSLDIGDGKLREAVGISEHLAPKSLKYRRLDWLVNMRIGKNGKGAFLP